MSVLSIIDREDCQTGLHCYPTHKGPNFSTVNIKNIHFSLYYFSYEEVEYLFKRIKPICRLFSPATITRLSSYILLENRKYVCEKAIFFDIGQ